MSKYIRVIALISPPVNRLEDSFKGETLNLVHSGVNWLCKSLEHLLTDDLLLFEGFHPPSQLLFISEPLSNPLLLFLRRSACNP